MNETIQLRSIGLSEIHKKQVKLLKEWRTFLKEENTKEAEKIILAPDPDRELVLQQGSKLRQHPFPLHQHPHRIKRLRQLL